MSRYFQEEILFYFAMLGYTMLLEPGVYNNFKLDPISQFSDTFSQLQPERKF